MQGYNLFSTSCEHCDGLMGKYACNYNSHTVERQLLGTILQRYITKHRRCPTSPVTPHLLTHAMACMIVQDSTAGQRGC